MDQLICASLSHTHYWYEVVRHVESTVAAISIIDANFIILLLDTVDDVQ